MHPSVEGTRKVRTWEMPRAVSRMETKEPEAHGDLLGRWTFQRMPPRESRRGTKNMLWWHFQGVSPFRLASLPFQMSGSVDPPLPLQYPTSHLARGKASLFPCLTSRCNMCHPKTSESPTPQQTLNGSKLLPQCRLRHKPSKPHVMTGLFITLCLMEKQNKINLLYFMVSGP